MPVIFPESMVLKKQLNMYVNDNAGVRFSGRPVVNGARKWVRATYFFYYSSPHGDSKYLRSCNILDAAKINISEVLSWLYRIYVSQDKSCVCDTFGIARNVAKP